MKKQIPILLLPFLISCGGHLQQREVKLHAILKDDLSNLHLNLYDDNSFELSANTWLTNEVFEGKYQFTGDTVIFLDPPYDNDFIPTKVVLHGNKLILRTMGDGKIDTSFASYFEVLKNEITEN